MNYTVYDSSPSSYYQNFIYTPKEWLAFDVSDTTTLVLVGSYEVANGTIYGNTQKVITITQSTSYGSTPSISIEDVDNREDIISFSNNTSYRIVSNIQDAPTQRNSTYETSYRTYDTVNTVLFSLVFAFLFTYIGRLILCRK